MKEKTKREGGRGAGGVGEWKYLLLIAN